MIIDQTIARPIDSTALPSCLPIVSTVFQLFQEGKRQTQITAALYEKSIILKMKIQQSTTLYQVQFDFELVFELIRGKIGEKTKYHLEDVHSIKFTKKSKKFELRDPQTPQDIRVWRDHLIRHLNQGGFHQIFHPIKEIGRGAFASVYLVQSNEDRKHYAIKAFAKEAVQAEENGLKGLINEIEIMRAFNHRNLMKIQGVYESKNSLYICVELLSGGQLYDKLKSRYKFSSQEIRHIMKGVLQGLETMHAQNYMHRDLKPENILFREGSNECVIADFGLAEAAGSELMFVRCGTPGYVAPEIVNLKSSKASYTTACDLFSLGVIFHLMVLGKSPFPGKTFDEVLEQNKSCRINFETFEYNQLPTSWLSLLKGLLEKDPKKRLTATQALGHQFFKKEPLVTRNLQKIPKENKQNNLVKNSLDCYEQVGKDKKVSIECSSPLMLTKNSSRKAQGLLREDSCLKFKMREAVMTGRIEQGKEVSHINSPQLKQKNQSKLLESRFKKLAQLNS